MDKLFDRDAKTTGTVWMTVEDDGHVTTAINYFVYLAFVRERNGDGG